MHVRHQARGERGVPPRARAPRGTARAPAAPRCARARARAGRARSASRRARRATPPPRRRPRGRRRPVRAPRARHHRRRRCPAKPGASCGRCSRSRTRGQAPALQREIRSGPCTRCAAHSSGLISSARSSPSRAASAACAGDHARCVARHSASARHRAHSRWSAAGHSSTGGGGSTGRHMPAGGRLGSRSRSRSEPAPPEAPCFAVRSPSSALAARSAGS